jgi:hypothetical protein
MADAPGRDTPDGGIECECGLHRIEILAQVRDPAVTGGKEDDVLLPIGATGGGNQPFGMHSRNGTLGVVGGDDHRVEEAEILDRAQSSHAWGAPGLHRRRPYLLQRPQRLQGVFHRFDAIAQPCCRIAQAALRIGIGAGKLL